MPYKIFPQRQTDDIVEKNDVHIFPFLLEREKARQFRRWNFEDRVFYIFIFITWRRLLSADRFFARDKIKCEINAAAIDECFRRGFRGKDRFEKRKNFLFEISPD